MFNFLKRKPEEIKFCKDCRWCELASYADPQMDYAKCLCPNFGEKNLVMGNVCVKFCSAERSRSNLCSKEAKYFEEKEKDKKQYSIIKPHKCHEGCI